ncbi:MAG: hypothetical protein JW927_20915 [Deltaproteobacteria bacterium]|nr:hypothetical protein [Deltaproteobacteria bacterium]
MKETTSNKMIHVIQAILFILVLILSATLYMRGRELSKIKEMFDVNSQAVNFLAEDKADESLSGKDLPQDDEARYKKKITELETRIADMQAWQDYLKEALDEYKKRADSAVSVWRRTGTFSQADYSIDFVKDFVKENNLPPDLKEKLVGLYNERDTELRESVPDLLDFQPGNLKGNMAERIYQGEKIKSEYDEEIAKLLSKEELALLKEYEKTRKEREFINELKGMLGNDRLEKEKEKELIARMYNYRQNAQEEQREKAQSYIINDDGPDKESFERMQKDNLEWNLKLIDNYALLSKGILSESQMKVCEGIVNFRKTILVFWGSEKEKGEE